MQIKYVAQAVLTFIMSCFLLSKGIVDKLKVQSHISGRAQDKIIEASIEYFWDKFCVPQDQGGLGFLNFQSLNVVYLAKQLSRLIQFPNSLLLEYLEDATTTSHAFGNTIGECLITSV